MSHENWTCEVIPSNGYQDYPVLSNNVSVLNTIPNVTLITPTHNEDITDRTPTLVWNVVDPDTQDDHTYNINISCYYQGGGSDCSSENQYLSPLGNSTNYTLIGEVDISSDFEKKVYVDLAFNYKKHTDTKVLVKHLPR